MCQPSSRIPLSEINGISLEMPQERSLQQKNAINRENFNGAATLLVFFVHLEHLVEQFLGSKTL